MNRCSLCVKPIVLFECKGPTTADVVVAPANHVPLSYEYRRTRRLFRQLTAEHCRRTSRRLSTSTDTFAVRSFVAFWGSTDAVRRTMLPPDLVNRKGYGNYFPQPSKFSGYSFVGCVPSKGVNCADLDTLTSAAASPRSVRFIPGIAAVTGRSLYANKDYNVPALRLQLVSSTL